MVLKKNRKPLAGVAAGAVIVVIGSAFAQQGPRGKSIPFIGMIKLE